MLRQLVSRATRSLLLRVAVKVRVAIHGTASICEDSVPNTMARCLLWVKSGHDAPKSQCPLYLQKQTLEQWQATLPDKLRRRLRGAQPNVKRWRKEIQQRAEPCRGGVAKALAAWRLFVARVKALPAEQRGPIWQAALAEVAALGCG